MDKLIEGIVGGKADCIDDGTMETIGKLVGLVARFKLVETVVLEVDVENVDAVETFSKLLTSGVGVWVFGFLVVLCMRVFKISSFWVFDCSSYQDQGNRAGNI